MNKSDNSAINIRNDYCLVLWKRNYGDISGFDKGAFTGLACNSNSLVILAKVPCSTYTYSHLSTAGVLDGLVAFLVKESDWSAYCDSLSCSLSNCLVIPSSKYSPLFKWNFEDSSLTLNTQKVVYDLLVRSNGNPLSMVDDTAYRRFLDVIADSLECSSLAVEDLFRGIDSSRESASILVDFATNLCGEVYTNKVLFACRGVVKDYIECILPCFDNLTLLQDIKEGDKGSFRIYFGETLYDVKAIFKEFYVRNALYVLSAVPMGIHYGNGYALLLDDCGEWSYLLNGDGVVLNYDEALEVLKGRVIDDIKPMLDALKLTSLEDLEISF